MVLSSFPKEKEFYLLGKKVFVSVQQFKDVRAKNSNIDFSLTIIPLKDDELVMSEM